MKQVLSLSLLVAMSASTVFAQTPAAKAPAPAANAVAKAARQATPSADQFFPIEQVKPGMRAVGYTVFEGSEPRKFELQILGVMKGFPSPGQNAVLSKLLGEEFQHIGVFAGISGSPVYIDGKLLGAIAFGYPFAKDAIGGITPIQQMVEVFEQKQLEKGQPGNKPRPVSFSEIAFNENSTELKSFVERMNRPNSGAQAVSGPGNQMLAPLAAPLAITGVSPEVVARFAAQFQALGLNPVAGVAGAAEITEMKKADANTLKPGSTVVVSLVRGDFSISAAGTVTLRDGNRIYAFGHPWLSIGVADFPMLEGEVITVLANQNSSFKLVSPTATVGAISGDRSTGVYGELGVSARMVPVEINLQTSRGEHKNYKFEMVIDRFLTPVLTQMTVLATIGSTERTLGDSTLQIRNRIKVKDQPEIMLENRLSTSMNAPLAAALAISQPLNALLNSGFEGMTIEGVKLDITSRDARKRGSLDRLWINQTEVKRGEKLEIQAFARTESGAEFLERIPVQIPADAPLGQLQVIVSDGAALQASEPRTGFTPKSLAQLVRELNKLRKADRLYVRLARSETGAVINNEELPNLPPSVLATLGSDRTTGGYTLLRAVTVLEQELPPAEFVIAGQRTLTVNVVNN
ncbi:MAG: hypothetical protein HYR56_16555 [Acidobacteria bacterium]|nr:hypothetical protein [Acidobacteriota bacterium]MBI3425855.1 hypothetical protein [Acidobacteriota bacterium]